MEVSLIKETVKPKKMAVKQIEICWDLGRIDIKLVKVKNITTTFTYFDGNGWSTEKPISRINEVVAPHVIKIYMKNNTDASGEFEAEVSIEYKEASMEISKHAIPTIESFQGFGESFAQMERETNIFINKNDGLVFEYYRTINTEEDNVLKEYTRKKCVEKKCLNLLTEDNNIPTLEEAEVTEWMSEYNTFSAEVSDGYFKSIFGVDAQPNDGDWAILVVTNTPFNISGVAPMRGITGKVETWKLTLSSYQEDNSIEHDDSDMYDKINSYEKEFGAEVEEEIENVTNHKENMTPQIYGDMNRDFISEHVSYGDEMYLLLNGRDGDTAVTYKKAEKVKSISLAFSSADNTTLLKFAEIEMKIVAGVLFFGTKRVFAGVQEYTKYFISLSFYGTHSTVCVLDAVGKEIYYNDMIGIINVEGVCDLVFGDLEIGRIHLGKTEIQRERVPILFSEKISSKSGNFYVIDKCVEPNNNPRAKESNYRANL